MFIRFKSLNFWENLVQGKAINLIHYLKQHFIRYFKNKFRRQKCNKIILIN
jgi:hypothetical protein